MRKKPPLSPYSFAKEVRDKVAALLLFFWVCTLPLFAAACTAVVPPVSVLTGTQLHSPAFVKWHGRAEYKAADGGAVFFYHTASGFEVSFVGTKLEAALTTDNTDDPAEFAKIAVAVDGEALPLEGRVFTLRQAVEKVTFAEGLPRGAHTLRALKRSEPEDSANAVISIRTDGHFTAPPAAAAVKVACVGGSGISGHGSIGAAGQARTTDNSSSLHGFGYLTARMLGADVQFVSASGWGLKYGYNQTAATRGTANLSAAFDTVGIGRDRQIIAARVDHAQFIPDIVIVNAGGNDYNSYINGLSGAAQSAAITAFQQEVAAFCTRLIALNPNVLILWTYTANARNGAAALAAINALPPALNARILPTTIAQVGDYGDPVGANNHASLQTHIRISAALAAAIESATPFRRVRENITA